MRLRAVFVAAVLVGVAAMEIVLRPAGLYRVDLVSVDIFKEGAGLRQSLPRDAYAGVRLVRRNALRTYRLSPKLYSRQHFLSWVRIPEASYPDRHTTASTRMIGRREHFAGTGCRIVDSEDRMAYARCGD